MLTKQQQEMAVNLAMQVECGTADYEQILESFKKYPNLSTNVLYFWYNFNDMTKNAIKRLHEYKCRKHLESCLRQDWKTKWNTMNQYVVWKLNKI